METTREQPKAKLQKGGFRNQQRLGRKQDCFSLLTKTSKEIFALHKGKFKAPPPMTTPVKKRNHAKFCEFHSEVGHNTDECMHLRKQIEEMLKEGKLPHLIKEIKQNNEKEQPKVRKNGETSGKDKTLAILMVQPWERVARQRITQSFSPNPKIFFPPLEEYEGTKGPMIIEAKIGGHCVHRQIQILVKIGDEEHYALAWMNFMVVRSQSPYNGIIRRTGVKKLPAVPSIAHGMLKIPVEGGVITLKSSKLVPLECAMVSGPEETPSAAKTIIEERVKVAINSKYPEQTDIFAWKPADMTSVPIHIAEHHLNVQEGCSLVRQKKREKAADRNQAIQEEVGKLVGAGIIREVYYHDWLSNPVMVKKHDGSWRMCVDYKDLNKACPKDGYPLPEIDWKGESLCGFPFKCFLDAYKGYHQIQMSTKDEDNTAFIASQGIFYYTKMPFGLRHAGATYQRLVDKAFHKQIGRNMEVYVDDLVIKSRTEDEIVRDVEKTFKTLMEINMKLNPKNDFHWTTKAKEAFKQMKQLIAELPMLTTPMEKEELIVYLAAAKETVSAVMMTKREAKQMHIYFVSRALRDFIVERPEEDSPDTPMEEEGELPEPWIFFTDGSSCTDGSGAGLILTNREGMEFTYALRFSQVNGTYIAKEVDMIRYLKKVKALTGSFKAFSIKQIPRSENKKGDALSKIASTSFAHVTDVKKSMAIKRKSWRFAVVNETLYKKSFLGPWLRCVGPFQDNYVIRETHEGSCSMHAGTRSVMAKALRTGYNWPTMHRDARTLIRACQDCQLHKPGIDIARPFSEGPRKVKFLIVAMDYFTKWIEAKSVTTITSNQIKNFVWDNVVCRFGLPEEIISNNGSNSGTIRSKIVAKKLCIRQHFASVKHPQTNGLLERANRSLGEGIKARLDARSKNWIEELPYVLWAHRTMIKSSNGDTPFSLTYGTKAVIPTEIGMPTLRTTKVDLVGNNEALEINLDLLEKRRVEAAIREAKMPTEARVIDKAVVRSAVEYQSKLRVVPISGLGQTVNYHVVSCAGVIGIKHRHNVVRDTLVDICYRSGISA
nr:reverse transcriptase domain-containing protein [Tanacetum cinerariifolium]